MTSMTIAQLSSSECLIEEISLHKVLFRVETPLTKMVVPVCTASVAIRIRPALLLLHLAEERFLSGESSQASTIGGTRSIDHCACVW